MQLQHKALSYLNLMQSRIDIENMCEAFLE